MLMKCRSTSNSTMASARRIQLWTVSIFFLLMALSSTECLSDDVDYNDWEPFREWIVAGRLAPVKSDLGPVDKEDDDVASDEVPVRLRDDSDYGYSSSEVDGSSSSSRGDDVIRRSWPQLLKGRPVHGDLMAMASKRSPSCMRKCLAQGYLHPAQCHSLC